MNNDIIPLKESGPFLKPVKKQFKGQYGDSVGKEYLSLHPELGLETWPEPPSNPSAAKFLRF